jgi:hypothetical protein
MSDQMSSDLPPGVHPLDKSTPWHADFDANTAVAPDRPAPLAPPTRKPFGTENDEALPVFQRAAGDWTPQLVIVNSGNPTTIVGRQKGRTFAYLWVPVSVVINGTVTATPAGICIGSSPEEATQNNVLLSVGDPPVPFPTEGSIYAAVQPGQSVGYVQVISFTSPPGGQLGIY